MRPVLRALVYSYISVYVSQKIIGGLDFGENWTWTYTLVVLGLTLLNFFLVPIFKIISLPSKGSSLLFMRVVLTLIILYVLSLFIASFEIISTEMLELRFFGFMLPSKSLTVYWSAIFSALVIGITYQFMSWLSGRR